MAPTTPHIDVTPDAAVARRFPLLPRTRVTCAPLATRVGWVQTRSQTDGLPPTDALTRVAAAQNLAALIASDCGLPDVAADLCRLQAHAYRAGRPYGLPTAQLSLQPVINLARLRTRAGDGTSAYQLLADLLRHLASRTDLPLEDTTLPLNDLVAPEDHYALVQWLRSVLLIDGTRALARGGAWSRALAELGDTLTPQLLDGRQIAIVACSQTGDHDAAIRLLDSAEPREQWETAVGACLRVLCQRAAGQSTGISDPDMIAGYLALPADSPATFTTDLGLCLLDLCSTPTAALMDRIIERVGEDAYAARAALDHTELHEALPESTEYELRALVKDAGLSGTTPDPDLFAELIEATAASRTALVRLLPEI